MILVTMAVLAIACLGGAAIAVGVNNLESIKRENARLRLRLTRQVQENTVLRLQAAEVERALHPYRQTDCAPPPRRELRSDALAGVPPMLAIPLLFVIAHARMKKKKTDATQDHQEDT